MHFLHAAPPPGLSRRLIASALLIFCGCSDSNDTSEDGSFDLGVADGFNPASDASSPEDLGAIDLGQDGGPPMETCSEEGATRTAPCGNCGSRSERCEGGMWAINSACIGEGACAPGEVESESNDRCLDRTRLCGDSCEWGEWDVASEEGECVPDSARQLFEPCDYPGDFLPQTCSDTCHWESTDADCQSECPDLDRSGLDAEICVPGGDVVMEPGWDNGTTAIATVSTYAIGRYDVTVGAYEACVVAGACDPEKRVQRWEPFASDFCASPSSMCEDDGPNVGALVTRSGAIEFCTWAGGRLPTLAEWTLAGRGYAPRASRFPWWNGLTGDASNDHYGCDTLPSSRNNFGCSDRRPTMSSTVDAFPESASPFGVEGLTGTYFDGQWFQDRRVEDDADFVRVYSATDPVATDMDGECYAATVGGWTHFDYTLVDRRRYCSGREEADWLEFRCVREIP